jgi:hypothetical protein
MTVAVTDTDTDADTDADTDTDTDTATAGSRLTGSAPGRLISVVTPGTAHESRQPRR